MLIEINLNIKMSVYGFDVILLSWNWAVGPFVPVWLQPVLLVPAGAVRTNLNGDGEWIVADGLPLWIPSVGSGEFEAHDEVSDEGTEGGEASKTSKV